LVCIVTYDRQEENAIAFALTFNYQTFSSRRRHHGQDAHLLPLFNGLSNLCQPLEPPLGASTFSLGSINIHVRKTGASPGASCQTFSWGTISPKPASPADGSFRKVFLDPVLAYIFVASCVANLFHFNNYLLTTTSKPHRRLSARNKVMAIEEIDDKKHMLAEKLYLLAGCLLFKSENFHHARPWLEFILSPRMPHADFACSIESSVVHA
jgi:hypothetical protein